MTGFIIIALGISCLAALAGYKAGRFHQKADAEQDMSLQREKNAALSAQLQSERESHQRMLEAERASAKERLLSERDTLRAEFRAMTEEFSSRQSDALRATNREQIDTLLSPLGKDIKDFKERFTQGQTLMSRSVEELLKQTLGLEKEASDLARALRADPKKQGNWGETVLKNILETSGLHEGTDFTLQERETDEGGRTLIPDVVVHLPGKRNIIVDSKVSLTAFTDYMTTDDESERAGLLKEHLGSVRRHIKELSDKDYSSVVPNAIGYVLMFIPNEASYITAVENDARLVTEAYARHIILINPTNLLMALQLANNLWLSEKQAQNVQSIYADAEKLYKKFTLFAKNFTDIGEQIERLGITYGKAEKQLSTGNANVIRQLEGWKEKGLRTNASIPSKLLDAQLEDET